MAYINGKKVITIVAGGGSSARNPYEAATTSEMASYLRSDYYGSVVKYTGDNGIYTKYSLYEVVQVSENEYTFNELLTPSGTKSITENGTHDITNYASANVNVASKGAGLNIHYGLEPPIDTSKLWVKTNVTPNKVDIVKEVKNSNVGMNTGIGVLPINAYNISCGVVGTKIYLFGGSSSASGGSSNIIVFDTTSNTITTLSTTLPTYVNGIACGVVGTKIYLFGGSSSGGAYTNTIYKFDTNTNTITTLSTTLPIKAKYISCGVVGTNIYLFGGNDSNGSLNTIYKFDTNTNTITTLSTTLPTGAYYISCGVVGTKIYLFGGYYYSGGARYLNTINVFDTTSNTIETLSTTLPTGKFNMACGVVDTICYLFGGSSSSNFYTNNIYKFDTNTNTITTLSTTLPTGAYLIGCGVVGRSCYLFGGGTSNGSLNTINQFVISITLNQNNILLLQDFTKSPFKLINSEDTNVEISIGQVYIGNANNEGEEVECAIYNGTQWKEI